jgi:hypothetical protein
MRSRRLFVLLGLLTVALIASCARSRAVPDASTPTADGPFTWIVVGDQLDEPVEGLVDSMVAVHPAFVVSVGDVVFESRLDSFQTVKKLILDPLAAIGARFYPVIGNHDFPLDDRWVIFWPPPTNRHYYSFDYGNSHFTILDTNQAFLSEGGKDKNPEHQPDEEERAMRTQAESFQPGSAQYEWLVKDLAETKKTQIFVFFHEPAFSYGGHEGSPDIQRILCPIFERYKVTAAFSGHSHGYERFVPLRVDLSSGEPVPVPDEKNGVVYVVAAGGYGSLYDIARQPIHAAVAKANHFVRIDVRGDTAHCTVIEPKSAAVIDSFELTSRRR